MASASEILGAIGRPPLSASTRRRDEILARARRPAAAAGRYSRSDVLVEHPRRREPPDRAGDGVAHELEPAGGRRIRVALVVGRDQLLLEDPVQVLRVGPVLGALVVVRVAAADGPAVVPGPALVPPAVEHADVDDAVGRGLHARRARRLERPSRVVEPHVDALDQEPGDPDVVVLEDEHATPELGAARPAEDVLDDALPGSVRGVRLAGEDDLHRPLLVPQDPREPVEVGEHQRGPLVGREAPREADGQDRRVEDAPRAPRARTAPRRGERTGCAAGRGRRSRAPASGAGGPPTARPPGPCRCGPRTGGRRAGRPWSRGRRSCSARGCRAWAGRPRSACGRRW